MQNAEMGDYMNVTVWNEYLHEIEDEHVRGIYPTGIHGQIAGFLGLEDGVNVRTATLNEPEHGLCAEVLESTDVLVWWGHRAHGQVSDEVVKRVQDRVLRGMGLIVLHSGHHSKIFKTLMGTSCDLLWRFDDKERIWCVEPNHPIAKGVPAHFELEHEEMYGERFDIPAPDEVVFLGWFKGGEVFRSGCTFKRGLGKIFYFQPGDESFPTYHDENVKKIITNAVHWARPNLIADGLGCANAVALEG